MHTQASTEELKTSLVVQMRHLFLEFSIASVTHTQASAVVLKVSFVEQTMQVLREFLVPLATHTQASEIMLSVSLIGQIMQTLAELRTPPATQMQPSEMNVSFNPHMMHSCAEFLTAFATQIHASAVLLNVSFVLHSKHLF